MVRIVAILLVAAIVVPVSALAQSPAGPSSPGPAFGFVAAAGADFTAMRRAGATAVKLVADWSALEPSKGRFVWKPLDDAVVAAAAAGMSVVGVLAYTPKWASLATGPELASAEIYSRQPPKRIADWEAFVTAAVNRYKAKVKDWQVWTTLNLPHFRGTASEYMALLRAARAKSKAADPSSRIVLATSQGMDLAAIRVELLRAGAAFDVISLNPHGMTPESMMRPLRVLRERLVAGQRKVLWMEWDPRAAGERQSWPAQYVKVMSLARAFGLQRIFWAAPPSGDVEMVKKTLDEQLGQKAFAGYLSRTGMLALVFGDTPSAVVAWSTAEQAQLQVDASAGVFSISGEARRTDFGGGKITVTLGRDPVLIVDPGADLTAEARAALQTHGLPIPVPGRDFSQAAEVMATLGKANEEAGLYNMPFRSRRNGAVDVVDVAGTEAVRTNASKDIVFIYFDVDDSFLFYVDSRATVEVSVEVHGAAAPRQLGFNLLYDSMTGYRFTPWQWVDAKSGWVTYTFKLSDANFSNTWGWDFAITAVGNRKEDLTVRRVTVRRVPKP